MQESMKMTWRNQLGIRARKRPLLRNLFIANKLPLNAWFSYCLLFPQHHLCGGNESKLLIQHWNCYDPLVRLRMRFFKSAFLSIVNRVVDSALLIVEMQPMKDILSIVRMNWHPWLIMLGLGLTDVSTERRTPGRGLLYVKRWKVTDT
jgi:hypothetical protein